MKALQHIGHGDPADAIRLVDLPDPDPGPNDIVLKMLAVPVHGLEVRDALDPKRIDKSALPRIPGLEGCGRVVFVGSNVTGFAVDDLALPPPRCGTYRQFITAAATECAFAPAHADPEQLALVLINGMTAALLLDAHNDLAKGRWIIQNAAGSSCGRWLIALAKDAGLFSVNIVRRDDQFDSLRNVGADACIVDTGEDNRTAFAARVQGVTAGADLHLGFDTMAGDASGRMAHCLSTDAKLVVYGDLSGEPCSFDTADLRRKALQIGGYRKSNYENTLSQTNKRDYYARLCRLIADQNMKVPIAGAYTFDDYAEAFRHARQDGTAREGKVMLLPNG
jgi:mitochondrial enoyl-[acyl-carrier protein] reductase / trans-2-enoyl-CoA reductase